MKMEQNVFNNQLKRNF